MIAWIVFPSCLCTVSVAAGQVMTRLNLTWEGREPDASDHPRAEQRPQRSACQVLLILAGLEIVVGLASPVVHAGLVSPAVLIGLVTSGLLSNGLFLTFVGLDPIGKVGWVVGMILLWKEPSLKKGMVTVFALFSVWWIFTVFDSSWSIAVGLVKYFSDLSSFVFPVISIMAIRNVRQYVRTKYAIPAVIFEAKSAQEPSCDDCFLALCCPSCTISQLLRHTADYKAHGTRICSERGLPVGAPELSEFEKGAKGS
jgi:hypothetical protein